MCIIDLHIKDIIMKSGRYCELLLSNISKGDVLESGFLSFILGMPLGLNTADKVAVRGQNNSKAPYDFTV